MLIVIRNILLVLLILSILGYIFVVVRQKLLLKNNIIFINKKSVTEDLLERASLKEFIIKGSKMKSGDEIRVKKTNQDELEGILVGVSHKEKVLLLITYDDRVEECNLSEIKDLQIISKYGYFF